jgi:hypothetical protein
MYKGQGELSVMMLAKRVIPPALPRKLKTPMPR